MNDLRAKTYETLREDILALGDPVVLELAPSTRSLARLLAPIAQRATKRLGRRVRFLSLDADSYPEAAAAFGVDQLPTVLVFGDGALRGVVMGVHSEDVFRVEIGEALGVVPAPTVTGQPEQEKEHESEEE